MGKSNQSQYTFINFKPELTESQKQKCDRSFFGVLRNNIIPMMNGEIFDVLYSQSERGRDPIDAKFKMAALIIKSAYNLSYDELDNKLEFDVMAKYAFGYEYDDKKPVSGRTLRRFLLENQEYQKEHGIDLINSFFENLAEPIAKAIEADTNLIRIDSTFIESSIKHLSRMEIIFESVRRAVKLLDKEEINLDETLKNYLDNTMSNRLFYYKQTELNKDELACKFLDDASRTLAVFPKALKDSQEYQILERVLNEQGIRDDNGNFKLRDPKEVGSDSVQSPVDPDATFRIKNGKTSKGYLGTDAEVSNGNESVVIASRTDTNNRSDSDIIKEVLPELKGEDKKEVVADGAYGSVENQKIAEENNIELSPTNLPGRPTDPIHAEFELNEEQTKVKKCPAGHKPRTTKLYENGQIAFTMSKATCDSCPLRDKCCVKANKNVKNPRVLRGLTSASRHAKAVSEAKLSSEEKQDKVNKAYFRNGVEALFNDLNRNYGLKRIGSQFRGLIRTGIEHTIAVTARNCKSVFNYFKRIGWESVQLPDPVL